MVSIIDNAFIATRGVDLEHEDDIEKGKQDSRYNLAKTFQPVESETELELSEDFAQIDSIGSVYCQDGIAIPFEIEQLFPIGYIRVLCNTTHTARLPLNVTRHETSRIRSDLDAWYNNVGSKIQKQIYQNVHKMLSELNLDIDISPSSGMIWERKSRELFGIESVHGLYALGKNE